MVAYMSLIFGSKLPLIWKHLFSGSLHAIRWPFELLPISGTRAPPPQSLLSCHLRLFLQYFLVFQLVKRGIVASLSNVISPYDSIHTDSWNRNLLEDMRRHDCTGRVVR